jgi:hypothetical protein
VITFIWVISVIRVTRAIRVIRIIRVKGLFWLLGLLRPYLKIYDRRVLGSIPPKVDIRKN